jgi:tRNA U34 2-thiouridine synthase MnmA/TrmU
MKAVGLLSGGLDSTLAVKMILEMGVDVVALKFTSPFCQCDSGGCCHAAEVAREMGVPLEMLPKGDDYLAVVRKPRHGYGVGMNPCIDCRIFMLKKAKEYMESCGAAFLFTGEVLGQRPMSQHRRAMETIEKECGLEGKIVRPLSAHHLAPTEAEINGWIDREKLLGIHGRGRKPQFAMAEAYGLKGFACPAGGCLLTDKNFAARLRDLFQHRETVTLRDIPLLKSGRHFRWGERKIICGRDEVDNKKLKAFCGDKDKLLSCVDCMGPIVLVEDPLDEATVRVAAEIAAAYSRAETDEVLVRYKGGGATSEIWVKRQTKEVFKQYYV